MKKFQVMEQKMIKRVNEWRDNNWVSLALDNCQWNSLLLLVHKMVEGVPSEDIWVCLDGQKVNKVTKNKPDSYLLGIRKVIDRLCPGIQWITTLNLADNYHQFCLKEEDKVKTAFTCRCQQ